MGLVGVSFGSFRTYGSVMLIMWWKHLVEVFWFVVGFAGGSSGEEERRHSL
jgi:hypothetical protein